MMITRDDLCWKFCCKSLSICITLNISFWECVLFENVTFVFKLQSAWCGNTRFQLSDSRDKRTVVG